MMMRHRIYKEGPEENKDSDIGFISMNRLNYSMMCKRLTSLMRDKVLQTYSDPNKLIMISLVEVGMPATTKERQPLAVLSQQSERIT